MEFIDWAEVRVSRVGPSHTSGVGDHGLELLANDRFGIGQINRIVIALAHLPTVGADNFRKLGQMFFGFWKDGLLINIVESSGNFSC